VRVIKIEEAKAGMRVAQDVLLKNTILVVPVGITLTDETIARLKRVGVGKIAIEDEGEEVSSEEERQRKLQEIEENVNKMFSKVINDPVMAKLCEATKNYLKSKVK
jgi:hypothetical protein